MDLTDAELQVMSKLRDGLTPSQVSKELGVPPLYVNRMIKRVAGLWKQYAAEWIKFQAYNNHLRYELLWRLICTKLESSQSDPDPKLLTVAVGLLDKYNRMLSVGDTPDNNLWLTRGNGNLTDLERCAKDAGLPVPKPFGLPTSPAATDSPSPG